MKILDNKRKIMGSLREKNAMKNVSFERKRVFFFLCVWAVNCNFFLKKFQLHGSRGQWRTFFAVKQLNASELFVGDAENAYRSHFR